MKTIEDRAEKLASVYSRSEQHFAEECYIQGATEQREIDIDKACGWLSTHNVTRGRLDFIRDFRKAMEE